MVRGGRVITPPVTDSILEGITRDSLIELCRTELNVEVVERSIDRSELYAAEEIFFSGTAVGVGPVIEVDRRKVGDGTIGPIATALGDLYAKAHARKDRKVPAVGHALLSLARSRRRLAPSRLP